MLTPLTTNGSAAVPVPVSGTVEPVSVRVAFQLPASKLRVTFCPSTAPRLLKLAVRAAVPVFFGLAAVVGEPMLKKLPPSAPYRSMPWLCAVLKLLAMPTASRPSSAWVGSSTLLRNSSRPPICPPSELGLRLTFCPWVCIATCSLVG